MKRPAVGIDLVVALAGCGGNLDDGGGSKAADFPTGRSRCSSGRTPVAAPTSSAGPSPILPAPTSSSR